MTATATHLEAGPGEIRAARNSIHAHLMQRVVRRGLPIDYADIVALEEHIERMRPAFEVAGQTRYCLRVKLPTGQRVRVVYDTEYRCLLTAWAKPRVRFTRGKGKRRRA